MAAATVSIVGFPHAARAADEPPPSRHPIAWHAEATTDDALGSAPATRRFAEERPFVHLLDPTTPAAGQTSVQYDVGAASGGADRTLPTAIVSPGVAHGTMVTLGATDRVAPFVMARALSDATERGVGAWSGAVGARVQLTDPRGRPPLRVTLAAAGFREWSGAAGAWVKGAASYDAGRMRLATNVHGERVFQSGRDGVDLVAMVGASYRTLDSLRVGAEWVGQDLEELAEAGAEGGARHYAGPTLALELFDGAAQIVGGPAFGLTQSTPGLLGRLAVVASF